MPKIFEQEFKFDLYHYTNMDALISIIGFDGVTLWASNMSYLNDSSELTEGINVVKEVVGREILPGAFRNYYATSFSSDDDCLSMWRMYAAGGTGFAIGLDFDCVEYSFRKAFGESVYGQCIYGKEEAKKALQNMNALTNNSHTTFLGANLAPVQSKEKETELKKSITENNILSTCLFTKNEAYRIENEKREIVYVGEENFRKVRFRKVNSVVVPYVQIHLPKEALKRIVIGPTNNSLLTYQSIVHMLYIKGYNLNSLEVIHSKVPFRG
jgi:hypothetical protein